MMFRVYGVMFIRHILCWWLPGVSGFICSWLLVTERFMTPDISKHELKVGTVLAIWSCRIVCMLIGISASRTVATVARQNDQNAKLIICPMPRDSLLTKKSLHVDSAHNPFLLCSCCVSQCFTALTLSTRVNSVNCRDCSAPGIRHSARVHGLAFWKLWKLWKPTKSLWWCPESLFLGIAWYFIATYSNI